MLKKRVITALWGIPLLIAIIWFGGEPTFTGLVAFCGILAILEFYRLVASAKVPPLTYFGLIWTLLFILSPHFDYALVTTLLLISAVVLPLIWLLLHQLREEALVSWAWTVAGILYVGWLLSYLVALRGVEGGRDWILFALFTTFGSDTTAFFISSILGRHKISPHISPGKTWEGAVAGVLGAIIASLLLVIILDLPLSYEQAMLLGSIVSVFGQLGDLTESLFKRNMAAKDSGKLLPGHGGILDRIDSVVFAGIVVYYYVIWVIQ